MSGSPDLDAFRAVRAYVDSRWPDNNGITIIVELGAKRAEIPVPSRSVMQAAPPAERENPERENLRNRQSPLEQAVRQAIDELPDGQTLTGQQVADAAGYPFNSRIRDLLARLVRAGDIANHRPGYGRKEDRP